MNRFGQTLIVVLAIIVFSPDLVSAGTYREKGKFWQIDLEHVEVQTPETLRAALLALNMPEPKKTAGKHLFEVWVKGHAIFKLIDEEGGNEGVSVLGSDEFNLAVPVAKGSINIEDLDKIDQIVSKLKRVLGVQNLGVIKSFSDLREHLKLSLEVRFLPQIFIFKSIFGNDVKGVELPRQANGSPQPLGFSVIVKPGQSLKSKVVFWPFHDSLKGVAVLIDNKHVLSFINLDGHLWIGAPYRGASDPRHVPQGDYFKKGDSEWTHKNTTRNNQTIVFVGHYQTNKNAEDREQEAQWYLSPCLPIELSPNKATVLFDDPATDRATDQFPNIGADITLQVEVVKQ